MKRNRQAALAGLLAVLALGACEAGEPGDAGEEPAAGAAGADVRAAELEAGAAELAPIDHSGVTGTVRADRDGDEVTVTVTLQGLQPDVPYTANLNEGRCASGGAIVVPLGRVEVTEDGRGRARVRTRDTLLPADAPVFVQVQGSGGRAVACADLSAPPAGPSLMGEVERADGDAATPAGRPGDAASDSAGPADPAADTSADG